MDLLLPRTDAGVLVQLVALLVLAGWAIWALRSRPEARVLAMGVSMLLLSLMGVRALH